ncbi:MAG: ABC transporter permease [Spirochaetaceae bacterium]|jgi:lipoprotein-releasing system permease protein|nr:ABC transporter permease [Spirochaetaceae bacterium]
MKNFFSKLTISNIRWVIFIAARSFSKKHSKSRASSMLSIFEIAAGALALTVIIAVMNGFQLGFIENILEISSYYIRIDNFPREYISKIDAIKNINGVTAIDPFIETQGIVSSNFELTQSAVVLRGLTESAFEGDAGLKKHLIPLSGSLNLTGANTVLLGAELAIRLGVETGDDIEFVSITNIFSAEDSGTVNSLKVSGIFRSGYYEYDASWGFINLDEALEIEGGKETCTLGIKLKNRFADAAAMYEIQQVLKSVFGEYEFNKYNIELTSWRDYNKSFFNALRTEKLLMFVLVGLVFVVVAVNIYQSQRRNVLEHSEDIGLLRAIGAHDFSVRWIFALKGLIIGFIGATGGVLLAILISTHIQEFFLFMEAFVNTVLQIFYIISSGIFSGTAGFSVFSKKIFYIQEYTARLIFHEVVIIYFFAVLSAFLAAWFASARISKIKPSEVLRYE